MSFQSIFQDYQVLASLLSSQREALSQQDEKKLRALAVQVDAYWKKILIHAERLPELDEESVSRLRPLLIKLKEEMELSQKAWQKHHQYLLEQRRLLKSAKRYVGQFQNREIPGGTRVSHSA